MAARGGGGRERFRRDYPYPPPQPRSSEGKRRGNAAVPSRHLWVGNLSNEIHESILTHHFQQFGDVESVAFQPGRSYAFINFKRDEDAIAAFTSLQGLPLAPGFPLKIEFAKAEKSSMPSRDEDYSRRDEPCFQRDSKARHASPEPFYPEKSRMSEKNAEPSEVLWIGFPALLKVDEMILRKAFSPFGEIEKITVFPGRSYAFVQFKSLMAACRAKETLQGKLFGNPRVHICFAKSESGSSHNGRSLINASSSPHSKPNGRQRFPDNIHQDEDFGSLIGDPSMRSPHFISSLESQDPEVLGFSRKGSVWEGGNNNFEHRRFPELRTEIGISEDIYERRSSPIIERSAHFRDFSPQNRPRRSPFFEDPWDLPEDASLFHGAKKLKTGSFLSEKELPEYPFSGSEQEKHVSPTMFSNFPQSMSLDKTIQYGSFGNKKIFNPSMNLTPPVGGMGDNWKVSHNSFQVSSASLPSNPIEWKWEGTIAKGGTPICRARCFPVGKVLDIMLPELLDCTARTGLDMLAKHYYQAANAWVVFFVPGSDADMGFYNEFMHYLGEKQRAAVTKLDEKNTLFLVPPSDFSEKVLKVPGKLSISGVVLRLEQPGSNFGTHHMQEKKDTNFTPFHGDASFPMPRSPPRPFPTMTSFPNIEKPGVNDKSFSGHLSTSAPPVSFFNSVHAVESHDSINENRRDYTLYQQNPTLGPTWSPYPLLNSLPGSRNVPSQASNDPIVHEQHATSSSHYKTGNLSNALYGSSALPVQESRPSVPMSTPIVALQPEQLAQLASSLLGQQKQSEKTLVSSTGTIHQSESSFIPSQRYGSELSTSQSGQVQQQQTSNVSSGSHSGQREVHNRVEGNQQMQSNAMQEEMEADPQKRLQATLQLAAALLQQIQQGKGT